MGNGHLRNVLYMVVLIAVCNKLLKQAFAIATKGASYQSDSKSTLNQKLIWKSTQFMLAVAIYAVCRSLTVLDLLPRLR
jgi:hypothetical protein